MSFASSADSGIESVVHILGVRVHRLAANQVVEQILHWVAEKSRRMVITAGPEFIMMTQRLPNVLRVTKAADLVTPDGIGVLWAARRQGKNLPERVTGVEMVQQLLSTAETRRQPLRVYLLGSTDDSLRRCIHTLKANYPQSAFAGHNGFFSNHDVSAIIAEISAFRPDVWLVGLGQPKQEMFIYESLGLIPPCVAIGVGGSIDVWGGTVKRAPAVFRRLNLEWLYRLLRQPNRWRRQLALPRFAWQVLKNAGRDD